MTKQQVIVGYDYTTPSDLAVQRALDIARVYPDQHTLHFVTVLDSKQSYQTAEQVRVALETALNQVFAQHAPGASVELYAHVRIGDPSKEILDLAQEVGADLIIVGSHNRTTLGRMLLGSVSEAIVDNARCTVLVARPKTYQDVELQPVVEVDEHHTLTRDVPHRYSYNSSIAQLRPINWPIG